MHEVNLRDGVDHNELASIKPNLRLSKQICEYPIKPKPFISILSQTLLLRFPHRFDPCNESRCGTASLCLGIFVNLERFIQPKLCVHRSCVRVVLEVEDTAAHITPTLPCGKHNLHALRLPERMLL
jgi:hypothetical protein